MGKSALLAQLVVTRDYIHHFNIAAESRNKPAQFLTNLCAQLIVQFQLPFSSLPEDTARGPEQLLKLLGHVRRILEQKQQLVIVIDALDEVEWHPGTGNVLYLPMSLPDKVYMVATTRPLPGLDPRSQLLVNTSESLTLDKDAEWQRNDVERYIESYLDDEGIRNWILAQKLNATAFVKLLVEKSEANFMYLRHVLPAIGRNRTSGEGISADIPISELPQGLRDYYKKHWVQMQMMEPGYFDEVCRPVLCMLAAASEAIPASYISKWTGIELSTVRRVLEEWKAFLLMKRESNTEQRCQIYHNSFREFLLAEVDIGGKLAKGQIVRSGLRKYGRKKST